METDNDEVQLEFFAALFSGGPAEIEVSAPGFDDVEFVEFLTVSPGEYARVTVPTELQMLEDEEAMKAIYVRASVDVVVYILGRSEESCGGYMAIPLDALGYDHYVLGHTIGSSSRDTNQIAVVATEDETTVTFTFPEGVFDEDTREVVLDKYEAIQIQTEEDDDLSGTKVEATEKVAVFVGAFDSNEYLVEQMPPTHSLGKEFVIMDYPDVESPTLVRVLAPFEGTVINVTGYDVFTSAAPGSIQDYEVGSPYLSITTDKPVLVSQYGDFSDPSSMLVPPTEQFRSAYRFLVPDSPNTDYTVYLQLVVNGDDIEGLILDDALVTTSEWDEVEGTDMVATVIEVETGYHSIQHESSEVNFGATLFGAGSGRCNFAFPAGMCLEDIREVSY